MTKELTARIVSEAIDHAAKEWANWKPSVEKVAHMEQSRSDYIAGATAYAERCEQLEAEVAALKQWKAEATTLLDPILEYGRNHADIKLGTSITEFVLNRAKLADNSPDLDILVKALEEIMGLINSSTHAYTVAETALKKIQR